MKKSLLFIFITFLLLHFKCMALVSVGGYVPFGPSTQSDISGSSNSLSFDPMLGINTKIHTPFYNQIFLPELDIVFHTGLEDGYSKKSFILSADFGYQINHFFMLRYGTSSVFTSISGDGGVTYLNNGDSTVAFYLPDDTSLSWNQSLNLGIDALISSEYSLRFEAYLFSLLDGDARQFSYSLSLAYYLF